MTDPAREIVTRDQVLTIGTLTDTQYLKVSGSQIVSAAVAGGGDALKADPLSQFAATTSLQLKGVISDETGSGALVFADTPTLITPILGVASATSVSITGTAGVGFLDLIGQSSSAATPTAGTLRLFSRTTNGFTRLEQDNEATTNLVYGRDNAVIARNTSGSTITKGSAVYVTGSTGNVPTIAKARADADATLPALGILVDDIADNAFGQVMTVGIIASLNTSAFAAGDILYVSTSSAGALTATRPSGTTNFVQKVAKVLVSGVGNGSIQVNTTPILLNNEAGTNAATWTGRAIVGSSQVITCASAGTIGVTITAAAAQTANLIDVNSSTPTGIFKVDASGYVGVGYAATALGAAVDVQISSSSIFCGRFRNNVNANSPANFQFVKTRSSSGVSSGDRIGEFNFLFHDSNSIRSMANFGVRSSGAPANNNSPTQMWFGCTPGWNSTDGYGDATGQLIFDGPSRCATIGENIGTGGTAAQTAAVLGVTINTTTKKGVLIKGKASQTANLFEIQDSAAAELFGIGALGQMRVKSGSNQRIGQATLVAGTILVNNTSVTANSRIFLTVETAGGTQGILSYTKVAATSFTINSTNAADTSVVNWLIVESV